MDVVDAIRAEAAVFRDRTRRSQALWLDARSHMPAGAPSLLQFHHPWPLSIRRGEGSKVWDEDGNEYSDWHGGFSVGVIGHGHPRFKQAIEEALAGGLQTGFLHPQMPHLADQLCRRFACENVVLASTGTEGTMLALRLARAATGRETIVKVVGGYHGMHDSALQFAGANLDGPWGQGTLPLHVRAVAANDELALQAALEGCDAAAFIIEPIMFNVGCIAPDPGYLERARELCDQTGTLLIFDEVKTGVTVAWGGAEELLGVAPDIKVVGKGIAGGVPCTAVLGPKRIMSLIERGEVPHYSTIAGNALAVHACLAALSLLARPAYQHMERLNKRLCSRLDSIISDYQLPAYTVWWGAKGSVIFAEGPPLRDVTELHARANAELSELYWVMMMNRGVLMSPGQDEQWTISIQHTEQDVDAFCAAFEEFAKTAAAALPK
jgi:glutamate-1-semialdehyde 2,1-aminomutase